nr:hypothetical protein [Escherichia coli]
MSIKNDGHYFCRAGGNRPDGLNEPVTIFINVGLGEAAKRNVGNGENQIPDMSFWTVTGSNGNFV